MAINNGVFKGVIDGKRLSDYEKPNKNIKTIEGRIKEINRIFNIDEYGISKDDYMIDVWDLGCNSTNLNTSSTLWTNTSTATKIEMYGNYLLSLLENKNTKSFEPKTLTINENVSYNDIDVSDKNYRLAPKEDIHKCDFKLPKQFSGTYQDYLHMYNNNMKKLEERFKEYNIERYGFDGGEYEYTKDTLISEEQWCKFKEKYETKIKLLKGFYNDGENLSYYELYDILKKQMDVVRDGKKLQFNKIKQVEVNNEKCNVPLSLQLLRNGLNHRTMLRLENNAPTMIKNTNVTLTHIKDNISSLKDMSIATKLAYNNRIMINPDKCPNHKMALDDIDYCNTKHIEALLRLPKLEPNPTNQLSILSYDLHMMIEKLYKKGKLSDKDLYIIEGIRYNIPQEELAKELKITQQSVSSFIKRIVNNITNGFIDEKEDLYYLNNEKGEYKKCSRCGCIKLVQRFDKNGKRGHMSMCKECR